MNILCVMVYKWWTVRNVMTILESIDQLYVCEHVGLDVMELVKWALVSLYLMLFMAIDKHDQSAGVCK